MNWEKGKLLQTGRYSIVKLIGSGGFGQTYLAYQRLLHKQFVIKRPHQDFRHDIDYDKYVRRFEREGQVLIQINHPNVVKAIDLFKEEGTPCLVMEYVEGETLYQYMRRQNYMPQDRAVKLFQQLAATLQIVHEKHLIHCDIHPGNIIIRSSGDPVLIDFGSAKLLEPHTVTVTTTFNEQFTPYEQRLKRGDPQPTWDVYGLAATLYFVVTGQKPESAFDRKISGDTLISPKQHRSDLSNWLNQAILEGMALEVKDRSSSMKVWLDLLQKKTNAPEKIKSSAPSQSRQLKEQESKPNSSKYSHKLKVFFPWIRLSFLLLSCIPIGLLIGIGSTLATALEWSIIGAGVFLTAWTEAATNNAYVAIILTILMSFIENATWANSWASAWIGCVISLLIVITSQIKDTSTYYWLIPAIGACLGGMIAGNLTMIGVWWGLGIGMATILQLIIFSTILTSLKNPLNKRYNSVQVGLIVGLFSILGLALGSVIGWWLKFPDIFEFSQLSN